MTEWDGVTLGGTPQRVTGLSLMLRRLTGKVSPELRGLTALRTLNLSWNKLLGAVPAELGSLPELRTLNLSRNLLAGNIPEALGGLTTLEHLTLSQNFLDGSIPAGLGGLSNLEGLYLYQNRLTGSIPTELEDLSSLTALFLSENQLTGCVPRVLRQVTRNDLATLDLESCALPSTALSYESYDTTGAVTTAGSYSFRTEGEDGAMTAVTTYEALRDGTATELLIHKSDAGGTSQAGVFDIVEAGDLFEWKQADDCFVRYTVTEVKADPAGTVPKKALGVEWMTYAFTGCSGAIATASGSSADSATTTASVIWGTLPDLGGTGLTAPVVHGIFQLVPQGWVGATEPNVSSSPPNALLTGEVVTTDISEARRLVAWRDPDVPDGWVFGSARAGGYGDPTVGYCARYLTDERQYGPGKQRFQAFEICGRFPPSRFRAEDAYWKASTDETRASIRETRVIAGRPAYVIRVVEGPTDERYATHVEVYDPETDFYYEVIGDILSEPLDTWIAIVASLFEDE